jgi:hypothetical protein
MATRAPQSLLDQVPDQDVDAVLKAVGFGFPDWRPTPVMEGYARACVKMAIAIERARV